ncbi:MAG: hypothetical protein J6B28_08060 [Eubacterium sp.]|nr:hypothetical protein [Eubacterium sp.]
MQSKISCFNRTIYTKNLTRFWPFAVIYLLYLMMIHPVILHMELNHEYYIEDARTAGEILGDHFMNVTEPIGVFFAAIVITAAVFGYLFHSRSANMMHAFPVTRTELFVTNCLSAASLMLLPMLLVAFVMNFMMLGKANDMIWMIWAWFGITAGEMLFFVGLSSVLVMFTGQMLTLGLFYIIANLFYVIFVWLINTVTSMFVYGLDGELIPMESHPLFPTACMMSRVGFYKPDEYYRVKGMGMLAVYVVVGIALLAAALYLYRKRRVECAGDFLSMRWCAPVCRWMTALIGGSTFAVMWTYLLGTFGSQQNRIYRFIVFDVICCVVFFFVAQMFIQKSFRVFRKKTVMECVSCVAVLLVSVVMLEVDVFGIEAYIPKTENIEWVTVHAERSVCFETEEDIEAVQKLHQTIVEQSSELKAQSERTDGEELFYRYISFYYQLDNGKTVERSYRIQTTDQAFDAEVEKQSLALCNDPDAILRSYFGMNYEELDWQVVLAQITHLSEENPADGIYHTYQIYGSKKEMNELYDALVADIRAGAMATTDVEENSDELYIELHVPHQDVRMAEGVGISSKYLDGTGTGTNLYLYIDDSFEQTMQMIKELTEYE